MTSPLVSVITLSHNYAGYIGPAIRSLLAQTYPHWELIVIDDASDDDSVAVVEAIDDPRVHLVPLSVRHGACRAYNIAYTHCRGTYVGTLDADDLYLPEKLRRQVEHFEANPAVDILGTWIVQIDGEGRPFDGSHAAAVNRRRDLNALESWAWADFLTHSSVLIRKTAHDRVGGLNPHLHLAPDFELWLRFLAQGARFDVIPEPLTCYRSHASNVSHAHEPRELWLERCFLFATHIAPMLARHGRQDLFAPALSSLAATIGEAGGGSLHSFVFESMAGFALLPKDYDAFRARLVADIEARHRTAWLELSRKPTAPAASAARLAAPAPRQPSKQISIVDDYFPDLRTGFRIAEFNWYLEHLDAVVYSTHPRFEEAWREYAAVYPHLADRVRRFDVERVADCALLYCVFLTNAYALLPLAEERELPLAFTLYPGGGLQLFDGVSDLMLSRLARSAAVRKIIVTQRTTREYLLNGGFVVPDQLEMIWGLPTQPIDAQLLAARRTWPEEKPMLDVCFAAFKYMAGGADKGYDTFVAVARRLAALDDVFRFHVAGNFAADDADLGELEPRLTFHGPQPGHHLSRFFAGMDLMIAPAVRFLLNPGAFDGFPTGCCSQAALSGVAIVCTDPCGENAEGRFIDGEELCLVAADVDAIVDRVMELRASSERLHALAAGGQARCRELYGLERQLEPRLAVLRHCLSEERPALVLS